ncbi:MAG: hypothetical protein HY301_17900 [Verrucomicrobia bacterium]|nr:hypothetical protein [Verrucomicrobiota bacterium]
MSADATQPIPPAAWQPFTFGGVAAFARASADRALGLALGVAVLLAAVTFWFLISAWVPVVEGVISKLPEHAEVRGRALVWTNEPLTVLSDSRFFTVVVDLEGNAWEGRVADAQLVLRRDDVKLCSLLGCARFLYPAGYVITLDQRELKPAWGAWKPALLAEVTLGFTLAIGLSWLVLATLGGLLVRLFAFALDRDVTLAGAWCVALASLMPGAVSLIVALAAYSFHQVNLLGLLAAFITHFVLDAIYLVGALLALPRVAAIAAVKTGNPFASAPDNPS